MRKGRNNNRAGGTARARNVQIPCGRSIPVVRAYMFSEVYINV